IHLELREVMLPLHIPHLAFKSDENAIEQRSGPSAVIAAVWRVVACRLLLEPAFGAFELEREECLPSPALQGRMAVVLIESEMLQRREQERSEPPTRTVGTLNRPLLK